jgi:hypothetical protein
MDKSRWNDNKCSVCGGLAHCYTEMYLANPRTHAPGMEYLCKMCMQPAQLPPNTAIILTDCAEPNCEAMANGRFEVLPALRAGNEVPEVHYLYAEHAWRWRQSLGLEWEMVYYSIGPNAREHFEQPKKFHRDDLKDIVFSDESGVIN